MNPSAVQRSGCMPSIHVVLAVGVWIRGKPSMGVGRVDMADAAVDVAKVRDITFGAQVGMAAQCSGNVLVGPGKRHNTPARA